MTSPLASLQVRHEDHRTVVRVIGEIDLSNAAAVEDDLVQSAGTATAKTLVLDLSALRYLDSSGTRALEQAAARLAAGGIAIRLRLEPASPVTEVLRLVGLLDAIPAEEPDPPDALQPLV